VRRWADLQELKEVEASQIVREGREGQRRPPHWHFTPFREGPSSVRGGLPCQGKAGQEESVNKVEERRDKKCSVFGTCHSVTLYCQHSKGTKGTRGTKGTGGTGG
jgi:hypothetical protein